MTAPDSPTPTNELLGTWFSERDLPDFTKLEPGHFAPALEAAMAEHLAEIDAIAGAAAAATFANTIEPLERAGLRLSRTASVFWIMASADTNPALQELE